MFVKIKNNRVYVIQYHTISHLLYILERTGSAPFCTGKKKTFYDRKKMTKSTTAYDFNVLPYLKLSGETLFND